MASSREIKNAALNLALMYHRQQDKPMSDAEVVKTAEKFDSFLSS